MDGNERGYGSLSVVDFLYLGCFLLSAFSIELQKTVFYYICYFVVMLSLIVDWHSANSVSDLNFTIFLFSDLLTVVIYVCIFRSFSTILDVGAQIAYSFIFINYLFWNILALSKRKKIEIQENSSIFFTWYMTMSVVGLLISILAIVFRYSFEERLPFADHLILAQALYHLIVLVVWYLKVYKENHIKRIKGTSHGLSK